MAEHEKVAVKPPHIWYPSQRVRRTAIQAVLSGIGLLGAIVVVAPQIIAALGDILPGPVAAWLASAIVFLGALSAALARVMALPVVNAWLTKVGAGSVPASAAQEIASGVPTSLTGDGSSGGPSTGE